MKPLSHFFYAIYNTLFDRNANKIIPGLYLGNHKSAADIDFIRANNISIIINCTPNLPFHPDLPGSTSTVRIPVNDSLLEKDIILMEQYFKIILPFVYNQLVKEGKNVLVHCYAGKQRSAIIVAALLYLIELRRGNKSPSRDKIFDLITTRRPQAFTYGFRVNFLKSFNRFYKLNF